MDKTHRCLTGKLKTHGKCAANVKGRYNECPVPQVYSIIDAWIHQQVSETPCEYRETIPENWTPDMGGVYTWVNGSIIVAGDCRAVFTVCYNGKV